jgi:NADPH:quinone reductase-like Zn-dependent oxidoreductase
LNPIKARRARPGRPVVAKVYALGSIVAAQREFGAKKHTGKIVLQP